MVRKCAAAGPERKKERERGGEEEEEEEREGKTLHPALCNSLLAKENEADRRWGEICGWFRENSKRICLTLCGVLESYIAPIRFKPLNAVARARARARARTRESALTPWNFHLKSSPLNWPTLHSRALVVVKSRVSLRDPREDSNDREGVSGRHSWARLSVVVPSIPFIRMKNKRSLSKSLGRSWFVPGIERSPLRLPKTRFSKSRVSREPLRIITRHSRGEIRDRVPFLDSPSRAIEMLLRYRRIRQTLDLREALIDGTSIDRDRSLSC